MIKKYFFLLPLLAITIGLYNIEVQRIYPFEFDTSVYFTMLDSLIKTGKVLIPIVAGGLPSICDINLNCNFLHPDITGQKLFTQMPPDYTSGISLLFIPFYINQILSIFYETKASLIYFIQLYSAGASLLYLLSASLVIKYSNINWSEQITYLSISFVSQILIIQYATSGIIGEFYASILISNIAIALAITLTKEQPKIFYYICAIFLGVAIESKISSIFPAGAIFCILILKNYLQGKSFLDICILILFISTAKLIAIIYYYFIFDFSLHNLLIYFNSIRAVYSYNAGAGMGWAGTGFIKQLSLIFTNEKINMLLYFGGLSYAITLFCASRFKNKNILLLISFVTFIIISSLIYPIIFKFPYTRILSPFFGLFPLLFLLIVVCSKQIFKNQYAKLASGIVVLLPLIFTSYQISPSHYPLFEAQIAKTFEPFSKSYPNFRPEPSALFLTSHFFGMPWDIYLSGTLDEEGPLNIHTIYGDQSIQQNILEIGEIYLIQSCRWGHCSKESEIERKIPLYKGYQASLQCKLLQPEPNTFYRLYKCNVKKI